PGLGGSRRRRVPPAAARRGPSRIRSTPMAVDESKARTQVSGPPPVAVAADENLTTTLWEREVSRANGVILKHHDGNGWRDVSWREAAERVRGLAAGLIASGIAPGDKVALMSATRIEWT